jgi:UDP-N-acetyl-2-amino-2-deoxyglucuronate dehydrogenase
MGKLKFGIIGCGRIAHRHADIIETMAELRAVCDIVPGRAEEFASKYGCNKYIEVNEFLRKEPDIEIVSVCTPNGLHGEHTIKSLRAGKHVICEKPMAISTKDCERMIQAAEEAQKNLFIVKQNRFNPPVAALKQAIAEGRLGRILNIELNCFWNRNEDYYRNSDWKGKLKLDGGILYTQFSHFIDLIYWMIGDVKKVLALAKNYIHDSIEFEDTGVIALEFENGALGTINFTVNSYGKNMEGSITVFGEKGTVKIGGQYLNVLEYQNIENYEIKGLHESRPPNDYGFYQGSMSNHDKVYENVIDVLKNNGKIAANGYEGMKTVEIIERIYREVRW